MARTQNQQDSLLAALPKLAGQTILVVGDVILDEYLIGRAARLSREAPIPVLEFEERRLIPGGAANPAANIAAMGGGVAFNVSVAAVVGADAEAVSLRDSLRALGIGTDALVVDTERPTTLKTRVMAHMGLHFPQQVARIDRLSRAPITDPLQAQISIAIRAHFSSADAILFSDYQGGLITPTLIEPVREAATSAGFLLAADAQGALEKYAGFGIVKCNADEARAALGRDLVTDEDFADAARTLRMRLNLTYGMAITRGGDGMTLSMVDDQLFHAPAPASVEVYDTVGAGDTAIAYLTMAAVANIPPEDAAALANIASGIVVQRVGNYAPSLEEIRRAIETQPNSGVERA